MDLKGELDELIKRICGVVSAFLFAFFTFCLCIAYPVSLAVNVNRKF